MTPRGLPSSARPRRSWPPTRGPSPAGLRHRRPSLPLDRSRLRPAGRQTRRGTPFRRPSRHAGHVGQLRVARAHRRGRPPQCPDGYRDDCRPRRGPDRRLAGCALRALQKRPRRVPGRPGLGCRFRAGPAGFRRRTPTHQNDGGEPLITDALTASVADLFNIAYEALLLVLYRLLARIDETDEQALILADVAVGIMTSVMTPVAGVLTTLPVGPEMPGSTAGPTFELFYQPDYLLPHHRAAWFLYAERLRAARSRPPAGTIRALARRGRRDLRSVGRPPRRLTNDAPVRSPGRAWP